jgi:hypothetical protein
MVEVSSCVPGPVDGDVVVGVHVVHHIFGSGLEVAPESPPYEGMEVRYMQYLSRPRVVLRSVAFGEPSVSSVSVDCRVRGCCSGGCYRVGEAEVLVRLDEAFTIFSDGAMSKYGTGSWMCSQFSPHPRLGAAGVDDLVRTRGGPEKPGGVRGVVLDLVVLEVFEGEPVVVAEDRHALVVDRVSRISSWTWGEWSGGIAASLTKT